jgi:uncharacterized Tic20 family protein
MSEQATPTAPVASAPMPESEARTWAMLVHLIPAAASLISAGTVAFVASLVIWLMNRERSALVDQHGKQNLNLQLTLLIVVVSGVVLGFVTLLFGFVVTVPLMLAYWTYSLVISIVAGVKAKSGESYRIPMVIRFLR